MKIENFKRNNRNKTQNSKYIQPPYSQCKTKNSKFGGFTLSEMLIAITIALLVISAALSVYIIGQKSFKSGSQKIELTQNARIALDRICRELRETSEIVTALPPTNTDPQNPPANEIVFRDANYAKIRYINYYVSNNNLYRKIYHYWAESSENWVSYNTPGANYYLDENLLIASQITTIIFYGQELITINLTSQAGEEKVELSSQVKPRNI